jgi:hypothetical protein
MKSSAGGMPAVLQKGDAADISTRKSALDAEIKKNRSERIAKEPQT